MLSRWLIMTRYPPFEYCRWLPMRIAAIHLAGRMIIEMISYVIVKRMRRLL